MSEVPARAFDTLHSITGKTFGAIEMEWPNGSRSADHPLWEPLEAYIADLQAIWDKGEQDEWTPIAIYQANYTRLVWQASQGAMRG